MLRTYERARDVTFALTRRDLTPTIPTIFACALELMGKKAISRGFSGGKERIKFAKKNKSLIKVEFEFTSN